MNSSNVVLLHGGLGNQLFQHAALRGISPTGGAPMRHIAAGDQWPEGHPTLTDLPGVDVVIPTYADMARWRGTRFVGGWKGRALALTATFHEATSPATVIRQKSPFDARPEIDPSRRYVLDGYFQHPSWFENTWEPLALEILAKAPTGFGDLVDLKRTIVKVRRTDYVNLGWDLPTQYFRDALGNAALSGREVVVSYESESEKIWIDEVLASSDIKVVPATRFTGNKAIDDFWNIAAADTLVLANSSFCWWAAAVATVRSARTRVFYPEPWIVNLWEESAPPDLGLSSWVAVPSGLTPWKPL